MLQSIRNFFEQRLAGPVSGENELEHRLQLATAALLVEAARADQVRHEEEWKTIAEGIRAKFSLSDAETAELLALAEEEAKQAVSDYDFVTLINHNFGPEQKQRIVELLWRVVCADGHVDKYEEHYVRRIAELLHVPHRAFIAAKLRVLGE